MLTFHPLDEGRALCDHLTSLQIVRSADGLIAIISVAPFARLVGDVVWYSGHGTSDSLVNSAGVVQSEFLPNNSMRRFDQSKGQISDDHQVPNSSENEQGARWYAKWYLIHRKVVYLGYRFTRRLLEAKGLTTRQDPTASASSHGRQQWKHAE